MGTERTMLKGMLAEKKQKYREVKNLADGYVISIRNLINPYASIEDLPMDLIRGQAIALHLAWEKCRAIKDEIEKMTTDLEG